MSFGRWLLTATVVIGGIAMLAQYDQQLAMLAAAIVLLSVFFHNRKAFSGLLDLFSPAR